jgi:hypothetical protein
MQSDGIPVESQLLAATRLNIAEAFCSEGSLRYVVAASQTPRWSRHHRTT